MSNDVCEENKATLKKVTDSPYWMQTFSGLVFDLANPQPEQIMLVDIAHHLSRIARFNGATKGQFGWSVAQHSLLAEQLLPNDADATMRMHVLLHDAHEAYIGDLIRPLIKIIANIVKRDVVFGLKVSIDWVIYQAFSLKPPTEEQSEIIKDIDAFALDLERLRFMQPQPRPWSVPTFEGRTISGDAEYILSEVWTPDGAKQQFIDRMLDLVAMRHGLLPGRR
jgi:5'-deoxynucleotidase YfbR-like HD superfamily hydrolase